jgi:hypothetical protein
LAKILPAEGLCVRKRPGFPVAGKSAGSRSDPPCAVPGCCRRRIPVLKAIEKKQGDIVNFPLPKDHKPDGSIVIWEYPIKDPPFGLYIAGCLTPGEKVYT